MLDDRFWTKVSRGADNECWHWTANKNNHGYGLFRPGGVAPKRLSHRLSYEDRYGPIPKGGVIMHQCDNPSCVNPKHLLLGSMKANSVDAAEKGRCGGMMLSDAEVVCLLRDYISGVSHADIAAKYDISVKSVPDFTTGKSRKWLHGKFGCPTQMDLDKAKKSKPYAKLSPDIVREIRRRLELGELGKDLANEFGIHKATISDIKLRKIWADA